jgi:hypothetical protein
MSEPTSSTQPDTGPPSQGARRRWAQRQKRGFQPRYVAYVGLLAVVVVCIWALAQHYSDDEANPQDAAIELRTPAPESKILQQGQVGVDLAPGYEGRLTVNGVPLPDDEVQAVPQLGQINFQPGPGKAFEQWPAGRNRVQVIFWRTADGPGQSASAYWYFTVV